MNEILEVGNEGVQHRDCQPLETQMLPIRQYFASHCSQTVSLRNIGKKWYATRAKYREGRNAKGRMTHRDSDMYRLWVCDCVQMPASFAHVVANLMCTDLLIIILISGSRDMLMFVQDIVTARAVSTPKTQPGLGLLP